MSNILEINNLTKSYNGKTNAIEACSFRLQKGTICAIVGESGSGKSTLLRLIAGLERSSAGSISINNEIVTDDSHFTPPQQRKVGFVFQNLALFPHKTVSENITFGIKQNKGETVKKLLTLIKMEGYEKTYPSELSGGQQQRVALARTLAIKPELLLLDEPFSSLDASLKMDLRREIKQIANSLGTTMIFITHDLVDAIDIADEIIILKNGKMIQHSKMSQFYAEIQDETVAKTVNELKASARQILNNE